MIRQIYSALWLVGLTLVICCVIYPAILWATGQTLFHDKANGSLVRDEKGTIVGSSLIAQPFTDEEYFHPRPSAAGSNGYDASAASGSNLAASNPDLRKRVAEDPKVVNVEPGKQVPADLVTTSGSGLDPHITLEGAKFQLPRVTKAWAKKTGLPESAVREQLERILQQAARAPLGGLVGDPLVNVLEVNRAVQDQLGRHVKK